MSETAQPLSQVQRIDAVCRRFEQAWKAATSASQRPRIEDYFGDTPEQERPLLLRELIALEIDYRGRAGEHPSLAEYHTRFPSIDVAQLTGMFATQRAAGLEAAPAPAAEPAAALQEAGRLEAMRVIRIRCPHCHNPIQLVDERPEEVLCPGCGSSFRVREARQTSSTVPMRPLGRFQLLERVGLGAFGAVWRARDTELERIVALKIPHAGLLTSEADLERFHREARAAAQHQSSLLYSIRCSGSDIFRQSTEDNGHSSGHPPLTSRAGPFARRVQAVGRIAGWFARPKSCCGALEFRARAPQRPLTESGYSESR
jgi:serine/threonine-protein kinase